MIHRRTCQDDEAQQPREEKRGQTGQQRFPCVVKLGPASGAAIAALGPFRHQNEGDDDPQNPMHVPFENFLRNRQVFRSKRPKNKDDEEGAGQTAHGGNHGAFVAAPAQEILLAGQHREHGGFVRSAQQHGRDGVQHGPTHHHANHHRNKDFGGDHRSARFQGKQPQHHRPHDVVNVQARQARYHAGYHRADDARNQDHPECFHRELLR